MKACLTNISFVLVVLFLASCSKAKKLSMEEYVKWYQSSDCELRNTKKIGGYSFIAEYRPLDYVVLSELKKNGEITQLLFDSLKREFEGMHYFVLKMGTSDPSNDILSFNLNGQQEYYNRVQYFAESAQRDFFLVSNNDTVNCDLYHFERTYNTAPYNNLILGFEKKEAANIETLKLHFDDKILGNGMLIFNYPQHDLVNIPQLKL